jgi:hypothetical protein
MDPGGVVPSPTPAFLKPPHSTSSRPPFDITCFFFRYVFIFTETKDRRGEEMVFQDVEGHQQISYDLLVYITVMENQVPFLESQLS